MVHIVDIPFVSRPKGFSSQEINHLKDPSVPIATKKEMVKALAEASEASWEAILDMDSTKLGKALSDTMAAWGVMLPYTVDPYLGKDAEKSEQLKAFVAKYAAPHTKGCLFSGAGGGFLMVISDTPVENGMNIIVNNDPVCLPTKSATIEEARAAPKCGPPPSRPPWGESTPWHLDIAGRPFAAAASSPPSTLALVGATAAALVAGVVIGQKLRR